MNNNQNQKQTIYLNGKKISPQELAECLIRSLGEDGYNGYQVATIEKAKDGVKIILHRPYNVD